MRLKSKRYRLRVGLHDLTRAMHRGRLRLLPHEWHELLEKLDPKIKSDPTGAHRGGVREASRENATTPAAITEPYPPP